ncbi:MAG: MBL fold metallo-hydrolase [Oscillospiraceae bacterium]|nr:MBL fold metallo-hydrolase [Oscillospiraceae bacterium]
MKISYFVSDTPFQTNCYIIVTDNNNAVLIDAPEVQSSVLDELEKQDIKITKILLTHGHCDHIESLALLAKKYNAAVYIHELDEPKLHDDFLNLSEYFADYYSKPVPHFANANTVKNGDVIEQDEVKFKVLHTPGHTKGSVCYITNDIMFSGDTLFKQSVGRTDMPDGNYANLLRSLKMLDGISDNYTLFPGHGDSTTLYDEKRRNPYMKGFDYDDML